jgi:hypothetical protein
MYTHPMFFPAPWAGRFIGRFFHPVSVHLGWSSYAAQWLSKVPTTIPGHFWPANSSGAARVHFERQSAADWEAFLSLRALELRPGGRVVIVQPAVADDGTYALKDFMDQVNAVLAEMVDDGAIKAEERARMVISSYIRGRRDCLAPFEGNGRFYGLTVEDCELSLTPDTAWADYEGDGNENVLARRHAGFFRSTFASSLILGLANGDNPEEQRAFADQLENRLRQRWAGQPAPMRSFVQAIALAKL